MNIFDVRDYIRLRNLLIRYTDQEYTLREYNAVPYLCAGYEISQTGNGKPGGQQYQHTFIEALAIAQKQLDEDAAMLSDWSRRAGVTVDNSVTVNKNGYSEVDFEFTEVHDDNGYSHTEIVTGSIGEEMVRHLPDLLKAARDMVNSPDAEKLKYLAKWVEKYESGL